MTTRYPLISVVLASVLVIGFLSGCGKKPDQMVASAKEYLAKSDRNAAIIELKNALQENPNLAEARLLLGRAQMQVGDLAAAEKELRRALDLKVPVELVAPALAEVLTRLGQPKKAIEEFASVAVPDKAEMSALKTALGNAYLSTGDIPAAGAAFAAALAANPDSPRAVLGQAYLKAGERDLPAAMTIVEAAIAKDGKLVEARQLRGDLLRAQGKSDEAIASYRDALAISGDYLPAHMAIISQLAQQGKTEESDKQLEAMAKIAPKHPQTMYLKAVLAYRQKQFPAARESIQGVLQVAPDYLPAVILAGAIDFELKSYSQAEANLQKALLRAPNSTFARRVLAATYLRQRQPAKALDTLKPLVEAGERDPAVLALYGEAHLNNGDANEAARYFDQAARLDPDNAPARTALALTHLVQGESDRGFRELEQIASADTGTRADLALIAAAMRKGEFDRALAAIDVLEKKQPDNPMAQNLRGGVMLAKRDTAAARKAFEKAIAIDNGYLPAASNIARLDVMEKKPADARKRFETVLEKDPKNVQALLAIAELRAREGGSADEVSGLIGKAIAADPKAVAPRLALVGLHLKNSDSRKAITAAQDGLGAVPDNPQLLMALGRAQLAAGDTEAALTTFGRVAQQQPSSPVPLLAIADAYAQAKNTSEAMQSLRKALAIKPDLVEAQVALMRLEIVAGRPKEALAQAKEIQKQRPTSAVGYMLEGDVHISQKSWKDAVAAYRAGLKHAPGSTESAIKLHAALRNAGSAQDAEVFATQWLKENAKDVDFRRYLAEIAIGRKDYAGAMAQYRAALAIEPSNALVLNNAAWVASQLKDPKALEYAEAANKLVPENPLIMDTLGVILFEKGDTTRGLELLKKAVDGAPKAANIRLNYARALAKAGQKDLAKKELETLRALGDKFGGQGEVATLMQAL